MVDAIVSKRDRVGSRGRGICPRRQVLLTKAGKTEALGGRAGESPIHAITTS